MPTGAPGRRVRPAWVPSDRLSWGHGLWQACLRPLAAVVVGLLAAGALAGPAGELSVEALRRATAATVYIKVGRVYQNYVIPTGGSGFFVSPQGHLLTNWHVVAPQIQVEIDSQIRELSTMVGRPQVVVNSGSRAELTLEGKVLTLDRTRDLALVLVQHKPAQWIDPSPQGAAELMRPVWVAGYPFGEGLALNKRNPEVTVTSGRISALRHNEKGDMEGFQLDAAVNPGNSGGPVLGEEGGLLGIVRAGIPGGSGTSLAIAPEVVRAFVTSQQYRVTLDPPGIYSRSQATRISISPLLARPDGVACELTLSGPNGVVQRSRATARNGKLEVTLQVDLAEADAGGSFRLAMRVLDAAGVEVHTQALPFPNYIGRVGQLDSQRKPGEMMRDRQDLGNRMESSQPARDARDGTLKTGDEAVSPLGRVARDVKLKKSPSGAVVLDNRSVGASGFRPRESNYQALTPDQRKVAHDLDEALFACDTGSIELSSTTFYCELAGRLGIQASRLGICRCTDGVWFSGEALGCARCVIPTVPSGS